MRDETRGGAGSDASAGRPPPGGLPGLPGGRTGRVRRRSAGRRTGGPRAPRCRRDLAVAYATTRHQFGRPIGSFQAVSHRCANMLIAVESARALVAAAAGALDDPGPDTDTTVCLAAAEALETAVAVAQGCLQVHGGTRFTWEHPAHRYDRLRERAAVDLLATA
ncbi:acyl-CoA dehydrogenase family protein [Streptomyces sp. NPDC057253]|uniref:acyl-CoA dehydrogenase family protein n=1 Tax=Streptomyces sp. NPDC057253 TaxID=3346069 RepID=UPI003636DCA5